MTDRIIYHRCGEEQPQCYDAEVSGRIVGRVWVAVGRDKWTARNVDGERCPDLYLTRHEAGLWLEGVGKPRAERDTPILRLARRLQARRSSEDAKRRERGYA